MTGKATNEKIIAIAIVAVLILAGAAGYFLLLRPGIDLGPVPQGWEKIQESRQGDSFGVAYTGNSTLENALAVFRTSLEEVGWSHVQDDIHEDLYCAIFNKGKQQAAVLAMGREPSIIVYVLVSEAIPVEAAKEVEATTEDVAGEDIVDVPRYPGAVRTSCEIAPQETFVQYLASADAVAVASFYADQLPTNGWALQAMTTDAEGVQIVAFKTTRGLLTISIKAHETLDGYTSIEITVQTISLQLKPQ